MIRRPPRSTRTATLFPSRGSSDLVEKTVENLPDLIAEAAALGLIGAKEKGVRSHFDFDAGAALVLVDKVQIQQVVINLIRNAVEAMANSPERQIWVCTRSEAHTSELQSLMRISYADFCLNKKKQSK